ncbi:unnamed protein product [Natator depressus]
MISLSGAKLITGVGRGSVYFEPLELPKSCHPTTIIAKNNTYKHKAFSNIIARRCVNTEMAQTAEWEGAKNINCKAGKEPRNVIYFLHIGQEWNHLNPDRHTQPSSAGRMGQPNMGTQRTK